MILILTQCFPPDIGGIENLMGGLADNLHALGEPVIVCADAARTFRANAEFSYDVLRFGGPRPLRRWKKRKAIKRLHQRHHLRAVITDSWKSVEAMPEIGVPIFVQANGMEFPVYPTKRKRARIEAALERSAKVIVISDYAKLCAAPYLLPQQPLELIHPPIDPQPVPESAALDEIRGQLADRGPILLTLARLEPRKGVDRVIEALPELKKDFPGLYFCIAGGGADRERLEALVAKHGVEDSVQFFGPVLAAQKAALLSSADLFVMPTRREGNSVEGFGISYVEAAWYGVPSIAGANGGSAEAVLHERTGLVCDGSDRNSVTEAISRLLHDDVLRAKLGKAAAKRVREELQWSRAIHRYLALISERTQA